MIRILSDNNNPYIVKGAAIKSSENFLTRRVYCSGAVLILYIGDQLLKIGLVKFLL
jgi:hypothetical protein